MLHGDGISTFPRARSLKELKSIQFDDDPFSTPKATNRRSEVADLKFDLNQSMLERRTSNNYRRKPTASRTSRHDPRRNTTGLTELELRVNQTNSSPAVHTVKDQEWLIQDLKKENFDLKLRLFMEQKEREKLLNGNTRETADLEVDLTEALDELEHAMDKETQLSHELNAARRREKSLSTKLKRLERVCQHQEEDIIRMSVELENIKMEMAAKDSGIASPSAPRMRAQARSGRMSPTSDFTDRYSDRLSAGYPDRWDRYSDRISDRGSDSGSYVTTPHERKAFFGDRFPDDMSTSDESETRSRAISTKSDADRNKRREKLLSRRVRQYQDVEENGVAKNIEDGGGIKRDRVGDASHSPRLERLRDSESGHQERAVDVAPDLLKSTPDTNSGQKKGAFTRPRWFQKKTKASNKPTSKSMDDLNSIGRIDVKNIHKKGKKYNFWGCVRARESINENIRSEYAPVKRPQGNNTEGTANNNGLSNGTGQSAPVEFI